MLLIGGSPRSGTTAVLQVLNSNPNVFISSEENILNGLQVLEKLLDTRARRNKVLSNGMRALSLRETLTLENIHSHNFDRDSTWPTLRFIYEYHHSRLHPGMPLVLWGDKLPGYAKELGAILKLPDIRYLHVMRNPLDVVNSMLRRLDAARQGRDWWKSITDFDSMLEAWAAAYRSIQSVKENDKVFELHYEELIFDFDRSVANLNCFLGVDLQYRNILVTDPALHFDRTHLTKNMMSRIAAHPVVREYVKCYGDDSRLPNVASAMKSLCSGS